MKGFVLIKFVRLFGIVAVFDSGYIEFKCVKKTSFAYYLVSTENMNNVLESHAQASTLCYQQIEMRHKGGHR